MKRSGIAVASLNAASVASLIAALGNSPVQADVTCASGTPTTPVICTLTTGGYVAQAAIFTGSTNVGLSVAEDVTGFGACGAHFQGTGNRFGLSTQSGSLETVSGSLPTSSGDFPANITGGGC